jgi:hypothetical protein
MFVGHEEDVRAIGAGAVAAAARVANATPRPASDEVRDRATARRATEDLRPGRKGIIE